MSPLENIYYNLYYFMIIKKAIAWNTQNILAITTEKDKFFSTNTLIGNSCATQSIYFVVFPAK